MSDATSGRDPFEVVAESFLARYRAGERQSIEELAALHPELAEPIRKLLPALLRVEQDLSIGPEPDRGSESDAILARGKERRLGDYRILREIGRGGMGVVYEAEQVSLGRRVALKVLPGHVAGDRLALERFRREAKSAARLHHTNIVPVYEVGLAGEVAYYAMQFIEGQGLDEVIDELVRQRGLERKVGAAEGAGPIMPAAPNGERETALGPVAESLLNGRFATRGTAPWSDVLLPAESGHPATEGAARDATHASECVPSGPEAAWRGPTTRPGPSTPLLGNSQLSTPKPSGRRSSFFLCAAQIGRQVAQGLAYAHASGIVHRDIKPSNLLLDQAGIVWIADFGLAKGEDDGLTQSGDVLGTLRYMAPCRFRGEGDVRADIYALGMTLYELLTLRPAFNEPDPLRMIEQIKNVEPPRPRAIDARIPRDLETIVLKAIEKDPRMRYPSAEAMAEDLRLFLADEPIRARQVSAAERYWRWARRNPAIAVLGGVLTSVFLATTVVSLLAASFFRDLAGSESRANQKSQESEKAAVEAKRQADLERDKAQRNEKAERWGRYRSNITAASGSLLLQNSGTARIALEDAPVEHRNWEWQYLHSQLDGASLVLPVPGGKIRSLVLSPSGRQVAVCCLDHNEVYLYEVATGRLDAVLRGHSGPATSVAYRPDGKQVATSGNDQTIRLWNPATGEPIAILKTEVAPTILDRELFVVYNADGSRIASSTGFRSGRDAFDAAGVIAGSGTSRLWDATTGREITVLARWQEGIRPFAFSPDGKRLAVGSGEYIHLCDAVSGRQLALLGPHAKAVERLAYSPDGKRIASSLGYSPSDDNRPLASPAALESYAIHLWDGESGKQVAVLRGHTAYVKSLLFSPDGSRLVSGCDYPDNTARLWDAATGRLLTVLAGHKNKVLKVLMVGFGNRGNRVVTASMDKTARLWDGLTGESQAVLAGHTDQVFHVLFTPDDTRVVTASIDGTIRLWDTQAGELIGVLRGHGDGFDCTPVFTPDGSRLVSGSTDGTVRIWDMSLIERNGILRGHESFVYDVAFSPDGEQVASASWDSTARLWDATTGRQTGLLKHEARTITSVAYSRDGRRLATRGLTTSEREPGVTLWDLASRKAVLAWRVPGSDLNMRSSFNPTGTLLAAGSADGSVRLLDLATGHEVARLEGHVKHSVDVAFHPDGNLLASTGVDATVRLWDVATRAPVAILRGHTDFVERVDFSADGKWLASGSDDRNIRLWDPHNRKQLAVIPLGTIVYGVAFSPDGTRLAAGCRDNTVRLFDVASRQQVAELRGHTDYVHAVAWSPDGTRLVSGSGDFTVRVWDSLPAAARPLRPTE